MTKVTIYFSNILFLSAAYIFSMRIYLYYTTGIESAIIIPSFYGFETFIMFLLLKMALPFHLFSVAVFLRGKFIPQYRFKQVKPAVFITGLWLGLVFITKNYFN